VGRRVKSARRLVSVGAASLAKASSEGWRLRLRPNTHRDLRSWDRGVHDMKGTVWEKDEPIPKLYMEKLRHCRGK
jgi:hypothetical protein